MAAKRSTRASKAKEIAEAKEMAKAKEIAKAKETAKANETTKAKETAKDNEAVVSNSKAISNEKKETKLANKTAKTETPSKRKAQPTKIARAKAAKVEVAKPESPAALDLEVFEEEEAEIPLKEETPKSSEKVCHKCSREFVSPRGLKKHLSACKAKKPAVVEESHEDSEKLLRAQLKGKFANRVKSLLHGTEMAEAIGFQSSADEEGASPKSGEDKNGLYKCDKCTAVFKLKSSVDRHKKVLHLEGPSHVCDVCGARCADKGTLARHQYTHTGLKPFQCESCRKQFSRKYHLDRHLAETKCGGKDQTPTYPCMVCLKIFSRKSNLREHLKMHSGETRTKMFPCEYCQKEFHSYSLLQVHVRKHTGEKPFKCDHCDKMFPSTGAVKKHQRIHTGERPYECKECGAKFALKGTLNRHVRIHTGIKPHKCPYCGKMFIQSGGLKAHLFHHTGENGFQCGFCNKSFNRKARLQMHIKYIHEKAKPFECDVCSKGFVRKEDLNRHMALHSGVKPFVCPTCNKAFSIKPSLKLHLLTHTREEPKACHECGRAFIRQDCLLRHMRKRHRDMLDKILVDAEKFRIRTIEKDSDKILNEVQLAESIRELLGLLVDEPTLRGFGWPDKPVDQLLEAVIRRCGHTPVNPEDYTFMDRMRENSKLLFTVVIDDNAVRTLLNNQTVDEVILHVLRLAKA